MKTLADPTGEFDLANIGRQPMEPQPQGQPAQPSEMPAEESPQEQSNDPTDYSPEEEAELSKYVGLAEKMLYEDDESHNAAMNMIQESMQQGDEPAGLARATMQVVAAVDKTTGERGIPEELVPGLSLEVLDMTHEMATEFAGKSYGAKFKAQAAGALMKEVSDECDLGGQEGMGQMLAHGGVRSDSDLENVMKLVQQSTFSEQE